MTTRIAESELILTDQNRIYHLDLHPDMVADTVITVGDSARVAKVSRHFDTITDRAQHREFVTHTGELQGQRISVISTGIGTDNIDIVFNELDALVNIDFETREIKSEIKSLDVYRIGTAGCLQADVPVGSNGVATFSVGLDGLLHFYDVELDAEAEAVKANLQQKVEGLSLVAPYSAAADKNLLAKFGDNFYKGVDVTCPGFYAPQGRQLRGKSHAPNLMQQLSEAGVMKFQMETAGLYGMAKVFGHRCVSVSSMIANRARGEFSQDLDAAVDKCIEQTLEVIVA